MRGERDARVSELAVVVAARDRVERALVRDGYARNEADDGALVLAGPLADYARRLGLVEPRLRASTDLDGRFSLALYASRYERDAPTLREGCPDLVRLVEETIGAKVRERFEPT